MGRPGCPSSCECREAVEEALAAVRPSARYRGLLGGNDQHPGALGLAESDMAAAGVRDLVRLNRHVLLLLLLSLLLVVGAESRLPQGGLFRVEAAPAAPAGGCKPALGLAPWRRRRGGGGAAAGWGGRGRRGRGGGQLGRAGTLPQIPVRQCGCGPPLGEFLARSGTRDSMGKPNRRGTAQGNPDATRAVRMRAERKWPIVLGGADCRILKYHVLPPKPAGDGEEGQQRRSRSAERSSPW